MTTKQHNSLSLASKIGISVKHTGPGHWDLIGEFLTEDGWVTVKRNTNDSQMATIIQWPDAHEEEHADTVQQAIKELLEYGKIIETN